MAPLPYSAHFFLGASQAYSFQLAVLMLFCSNSSFPIFLHLKNCRYFYFTLKFAGKDITYMWLRSVGSAQRTHDEKKSCLVHSQSAGWYISFSFLCSIFHVRGHPLEMHSIAFLTLQRISLSFPFTFTHSLLFLNYL